MVGTNVDELKKSYKCHPHFITSAAMNNSTHTHTHTHYVYL